MALRFTPHPSDGEVATVNIPFQVDRSLLVVALAYPHRFDSAPEGEPLDLPELGRAQVEGAVREHLLQNGVSETPYYWGDYAGTRGTEIAQWAELVITELYPELSTPTR